MAEWNDLKKPLGLDLARHNNGPTLNSRDIEYLKDKLPSSGRALVLVIEKIEATLDRSNEPTKHIANQLARHIAANIIEMEDGDTPNSDELASRARLIAIIKTSEPYVPLASIKGFGLGVFDVGKGFAASATHPLDTAQGLAYTFNHPIDTWHAMQEADRTRLIEILRTDDDAARRAAYAEIDTASLLNTYLTVTGSAASIKTAANMGKSGLNAIKQHLDKLPPPGGAMVTSEGPIMSGAYAAKTGNLIPKIDPLSLGIVSMAGKGENSEPDPANQGDNANLSPKLHISAEKQHALIYRFVNELLDDYYGSRKQIGDLEQNIMATLQKVCTTNSAEVRQQAVNTLWNQVRYLAPHNTDPAAWMKYAFQTRYIGTLLEQELNSGNPTIEIKLPGLAQGTQGVDYAYIPDYNNYPSIYARADKAFSRLAATNYHDLHQTESVLTRIPLSKDLALNPKAQAILVTEEQTSGFKQSTGSDGQLFHTFEFGKPKYRFILAENELGLKPIYTAIEQSEAQSLVIQADRFDFRYPNNDIALLAMDRAASWHAALEMANPSLGGPGL